jgi:hypothetical protein
MSKWKDCETRGPWVRNSLKSEISELRSAAKKARGAYQQDFMGKPCAYIADAYDAAADVLEARLNAISPKDDE